MKLYEYLARDKTEKRWIPSDTAELPRGSHWDEFVSLLKLTGVLAAIYGLVWAMTYFDAG